MPKALFARGSIASLLLMLLLVAMGCTATVTPPEHPLHPVKVFVADYGRHSSLFLPVKHAGYLEYSFGDWNFYVMNNVKPWDATEALFYSRGAAFGRRFAPIDPDAGGPIPYGKPRVISLCVARADADRVLNELETRWTARQSASVHNDYDDTEFVHDERPYAWNTNCNHVTANLLRDLGCRVTGATWLSHFYINRDSEGTMDYCE